MNSSVLDTFGLGSIDPGIWVILTIILLLFSVVVLVLLIIQTNRMNELTNRLNVFLKGKNNTSLEKILVEIVEDNDIIKKAVKKNRKEIKKIYNNLEYAYQKLGVVKYDAVHQMGGQLSFALALLNQNNDGFVLNNIRSSQGSYAFTKEIRNGVSKIELGEEEQEALDIAMSMVTREESTND